MNTNYFKTDCHICNEFIVDLTVPSYIAFEQYLCDIDIGILHDRLNNGEVEDAHFYLLLIHLAKRFGSEHLMKHYFQTIHKHHLSSSTCVDVLELAIQLSYFPSILDCFQFLTQSCSIFVQSTCFVSKQQKLQNCINFLFAYLLP